ncbi:NADPH:quinone reductase [Streptomyces sp. NPDC054864]
MLAAHVTHPCDASLIRYGHVPDPVPGPADVLVAVDASPVNPIDTAVRSGAYRTPLPLPFVIGRDLVGTVRAVGAQVREHRAGDRVWCNSLGHDGRQGAASELAVVPAERLYPLPPDTDPVEAVALLHPVATAHLALFTHGDLYPGTTVVVGGAAGNVGSALVHLASRHGARVVVTARAEDAAYCRSLGAAEVVDYRDPNLIERLTSACPDGAGLFLDTSGSNPLADAVGLLTPRGRIVITAASHATRPLPVDGLYTKDISVTGFTISTATVQELAEAAAQVNAVLTEGSLRSRAIRRLPLHEAGQAHAAVERGSLRGERVVLLTDRASRR